MKTVAAKDVKITIGKRCEHVEPDVHGETTKPGMSEGDIRAWRDRHRCKEDGDWLVWATGKKETRACAAHIADAVGKSKEMHGVQYAPPVMLKPFSMTSADVPAGVVLMEATIGTRVGFAPFVIGTSVAIKPEHQEAFMHGCNIPPDMLGTVIANSYSHGRWCSQVLFNGNSWNARPFIECDQLDGLKEVNERIYASLRKIQ